VNTIKIAEMVQDLVGRAEAGDLDAQYSLAEGNRCGGYGFARSYVESEKWYLPGAKQGNVCAAYGLGSLYLRCLGNRAEGLRLLELAGRHGDTYACYELAKALSQPGSQGSDKVAAYVWFCLSEAYDRHEGRRNACEKEIQKLESELSLEEMLAAQLRIREEFQPLVVLAASEETEA